MEDSEKSFAAKYGFNKVSKNVVKSVLEPESIDSVDLCRRTYKITEANDMQLKQLEKRIKGVTGKPVGQSSIIRALIQLCATDFGTQQKVMQLVAKENIHWGRPKNSQ